MQLAKLRARFAGSLNGISFEPAVDYPAGAGPSSVAVGDFNGDGAVSWHSQSSIACITTTEGRRDAPRAVWMEKVANTAGREGGLHRYLREARGELASRHLAPLRSQGQPVTLELLHARPWQILERW